METKLNDNEVKEVARMQQLIDTYECFVISMHMMVSGNEDVKVPVFTDTAHEKEMSDIWNWIKERKDKE